MSTLRTGGEYATEQEAKDAFMSAYYKYGMNEFFHMDDELTGYYLHGRASTSKTPRDGARIDALLWPHQRMVDLGWNFGAIGMEFKKSGHKVPIPQAMDMLDAAFYLHGGVQVRPTWMGIWPMDDKPKGEFAHVCDQFRITYVSVKYDQLRFLTGGAALLTFKKGCEPVIGQSHKNGNNRGSR